MAKRGTAQPAEAVAVAAPQGRSATANDVYRMPYETGGSAADSIADSLLDSILEPDEGQPAEAEPVVEESTDEASDEGEPEAELDEQPADEGEPTEEAAEEPADAPEPTYTVTVNGAEQQVKLSELLSGYSREADYRQKTQTLAEQRRQTEAERAQYAEKLNEVVALLEQQQPKPPSDALRAEDPAEWSAQMHEYERRVGMAEARKAEAADLWNRSLAEIQQAESQKLREAVPEWGDAKVYETEKTAMVGYAEALGFTVEQLNGVTDHRLMLMLRDAAKYRALQQKTAEPIRKQVAKAKVLVPGGKTPGPKVPESRKAEVRAARERLAQSGSVHDAAALIERMLGEDD